MTTLTHPNDTQKKLLSLALPMAGTQLIVMGSSFLCMGMIATLGHDVLAASALIFSTQMAILATAMSVLFSLSILIGHSFGAKQYTTAGQFVQQGWTLALCLSIPVIFFFSHIGKILIYFGQAKGIADIVQTFFYAANWRVVPLLFGVCNQQLCYGSHKQKLDITANTLGVVVLVSSAYVLIYGKLGFPALGVAGLGYAQAIQAFFYLAFTTSYLYFAAYFKPFELFRYRVHKDLSKLAQMFKIGWPISAQIGGEMLSMFVGAAFIGWLGVHALAAYQVVTQYLFLILIPIYSLSQAAGILVGQACGAQQFQEIKKIGYTCLRIVAIISIITGLIFLLLPRVLASFYLDVHNPVNTPTVNLIILLFAVVAFSQLFDAIRNVLTGALRGLLDTRFPMYAGLIVIWLIGLPLGYFLAFPCKLGVVGMATGSLVGMCIGAIIIFLRWRSLIKKY